MERLLFEFPLLFGFWKKLARLQCEHKGDWTKCEEVRGLTILLLLLLPTSLLLLKLLRLLLIIEMLPFLLQRLPKIRTR